jgi:hypothetical protein
MLETIASIIILIGAVCVAVTNIWKFFASGKKGIQEHVEQVQENQRCAEEIRVRDIIAQVQEEQCEQVHKMVLDIMKEALPGALTEHYKKIRD